MAESFVPIKSENQPKYHIQRALNAICLSLLKQNKTLYKITSFTLTISFFFSSSSDDTEIDRAFKLKSWQQPLEVLVVWLEMHGYGSQSKGGSFRRATLYINHDSTNVGTLGAHVVDAITDIANTRSPAQAYSHI